MTEEYFRKNYPDVCYNGKPLSPYWDLFQDGVEFGERQSEKRIEELEKENAELKARLNAINLLTPELEKSSKLKKQQLTKAIELLKWALHSDPEHDDLADFDTKWKEAEQFIKDLEK